MIRFLGEEVVSHFQKQGIHAESLTLDPLLPALSLTDSKAWILWWKFFKDLGASTVDDVAEKGAFLLAEHPLIPRHVRVSAFVYEVETHRLRHPHERIWEKTSGFLPGIPFRQAT
jgi:hypothetical protein